MGSQSREEEERNYFMCRIKDMQEDIDCGIHTKEMPRPNIVKYHDLLQKLWGWDKLLPKGNYVSWSDYSNYLEQYHRRNVDAISSIAALAQTCLEIEKQLMTQWSIQMKSENLPMRKSIILSCLIHERVDSFINTGCTSFVEDHLEKLGAFERLLQLSGSVKWAVYRSYLEEYCNAGAPANQNSEDSQSVYSSYIGADLAKSCLKMEDELLSEWNTRVSRSLNDTLAVGTIIQSSLIKELALSICSTGGECFSPSDVAFVCITKEADLMCELLKHGAEPFDDIIEQSSVIRMCAFGLANLKGHQSISAAAAAAMLDMAYEAKKISDWIKREKKLVIFSFSEHHDLEECRLIRIKTLGVMTRILQDSSFPCPRVRDVDAMACD